MIRRLVIFILLFLTITSFKNPIKRMERFKSWYSEHSAELIKSEQRSDFSFQLKYISKEEKISKELSKSSNTDKIDIAYLNELYSSYLEFSFRISEVGVQDLIKHHAVDEADYNDILFYLLDEITQDFTLKSDLHEIKPLRCNFENNYGSAPYLNFHVVFENIEIDTNTVLIYEDFLFGNSEISFDLSFIKELKIPKIK